MIFFSPRPIREHQVYRPHDLLANPKKIFEIGTFQGYTSLILAMNAPKAHVYTLDLPKDYGKTKFRLGRFNLSYVGYSGRMAFQGTRYAPRITRLYGDSAVFKFSPFKDAIDFVFIDGAHTYQYTKNDTRKVRSMSRDGGMVAWHDYNPDYWPGTVRFLDGLAKKRQLFHIKDTSLVFMLAGEGSLSSE